MDDASLLPQSLSGLNISAPDLRHLGRHGDPADLEQAVTPKVQHKLFAPVRQTRSAECPHGAEADESEHFAALILIFMAELRGGDNISKL
jgi:hypothetical protein